MQASRLDQLDTFEDGEIIVVEGEHGREMFVIQEGRVEVTKRVDGRDERLAVLGRGEFFGEMSLLEGLPRHATVRAMGRVKLLVVEPGSLLLRIRRDPTFAFEMLQHMSRRVRDLDDRLLSLLAAPASLPGAGPTPPGAYRPPLADATGRELPA